MYIIPGHNPAQCHRDRLTVDCPSLSHLISTTHQRNPMENPHNERQAILLQRIVKSVVRTNPPCYARGTPYGSDVNSRLNATISFKSSTIASRSVGIFQSFPLHPHSDPEHQSLFNPKRNVKPSRSQTPKNTHAQTFGTAFPALVPQEIVQANEEIRLGADLASKYRKNAQFNIEALRANGALPSDDASGILGGRGGKTPTIDDPQP